MLAQHQGDIRIITMSSTYSVSEAQSQLPKLLRRVQAGEPISISRRDETVAYVMSRSRVEAIVETLELLANPEAMAAIEAHRSRRMRFIPLGKSAKRA